MQKSDSSAKFSTSNASRHCRCRDISERGDIKVAIASRLSAKIHDLEIFLKTMKTLITSTVSNNVFKSVFLEPHRDDNHFAFQPEVYPQPIKALGFATWNKSNKLESYIRPGASPLNSMDVCTLVKTQRCYERWKNTLLLGNHDEVHLLALIQPVPDRK